MAEGVLGHLAISKQNSFGTNTASWNFIPIISESVAMTVEQIRRGSIVGRTAEGIAERGVERVSGDISMEPHPEHMGFFLRGITGQSSSSVVGSVAAFNNFVHEFIPRNAKFDAKCALPPYTIQVHRDVTSAFQYTDALFTRLELNVQGGALVQMTAGVLARTTSIMAASTATFSEPSPWTWNVASLSIGGAAVDFAESLSVTIEQPVEGVIMLDGTTRVNRFVRTNPTMVRVRGKVDFQDLTEFNAFKNQTQRRMLLTLGAAVSSGPFLTIDVPKMLYNTFPAQIGGPGRIGVDFEASGEYDTTSSYAIRITLTNTVASY